MKFAVPVIEPVASSRDIGGVSWMNALFSALDVAMAKL